ncbi:hypothetical protein, partial [Bradyrhizobium ottawaense]|uniref:hypothetical protein n=1 Tax=Bradyrhizobium ottawaense TaxID=931866 RepID=UPI0030C76BA6
AGAALVAAVMAGHATASDSVMYFGSEEQIAANNGTNYQPCLSYGARSGTDALLMAMHSPNQRRQSDAAEDAAWDASRCARGGAARSSKAEQLNASARDHAGVSSLQISEVQSNHKPDHEEGAGGDNSRHTDREADSPSLIQSAPRIKASPWRP